MGTGILFVDDDRDILQGLRRSMKRNRNRFDMRFVESGKDALAALEEYPADIVVSDMRMPGMDGSELLSAIRDRFPGTIRIILSGYAEKEAVMRTVGPAHQYLSKPCNTDSLCASIDRAIALRDHLDSPVTREFVTGLSHLPTLPETVSRLMDELSSADRSIESIARTISSDISMTAQIMKLANSSYFAIAKTVTTLNQAIQMLGFDTIKALILVSGIFDMYPANPASAAIIRQLNERCVSIGLMAKGLATLEGLDKPDADQAACAGMLSHVGTLALVHEDIDRFNQAVALVENDKIDIAAAEHKVFGSSHAEVGAYLLGLWGFSDMVVEAVACHHDPGRFQTGAFDANLAVYVAQIMCRALDMGEAALPELEDRLDKSVLEAAGVLHRLPAWREFFTREIRKRS